MRERMKMFTFLSGSGSTLIEPKLEDHINDWLAHTPGRVTAVTQSESQRTHVGQHVTVCVWYVPDDETGAF